MQKRSVQNILLPVLRLLHSPPYKEAAKFSDEDTAGT